MTKVAIEEYLYGMTSNNEPYRDTCREGEIECYQYLVKCIEKANIVQEFEIDEIKNVLKEQVKKFVEKDSSKWDKYCYKPSQFIDSPDSLFYEGNEECIIAELEYILNKRNKDGVWDIVWSWGKYADEFAISRNWWKANIVINNLLLMKKFGKWDGNII